MPTRRHVSQFNALLTLAAFLLFISLRAVVAEAANSTEPDDSRFPNVSDWLEFSGQFEIEITRDQNFNLEPTPNDTRHQLRPELQLETEIQARDDISFFFLVEVSHEFVIQNDTDEDESNHPMFLFQEAYVTLDDLFGTSWSLRIGRQTVEDERQWLFDDELDAMRLSYHGTQFRLEAFLGRVQFLDESVIRGQSRNGTDYVQLYAQYEIDAFLTFAAYALVQDDNMPMGERPVFFGLRASGEWEPGRLDWLGLSYWLDVAHVRGKSEGHNVRGWGLDVGFIATFDVIGRPSLMVAYAFGSGNGKDEDDTDHAYRQSGLQSNAAELGGVTEIQYYGELLDPELSNLHIWTIGLGLHPVESISLTVLYLNYRQDRPSDELRDVAIDAEPTGLSRDIGHEIDLVGEWASDALELQLVLGAFFPGRAFPSKTDHAFFSQLTLAVSF